MVNIPVFNLSMTAHCFKRSLVLLADPVNFIIAVIASTALSTTPAAYLGYIAITLRALLKAEEAGESPQGDVYYTQTSLGQLPLVLLFGVMNIFDVELLQSPLLFAPHPLLEMLCIMMALMYFIQDHLQKDPSARILSNLKGYLVSFYTFATSCKIKAFAGLLLLFTVVFLFRVLAMLITSSIVSSDNYNETYLLYALITAPAITFVSAYLEKVAFLTKN